MAGLFFGKNERSCIIVKNYLKILARGGKSGEEKTGNEYF